MKIKMRLVSACLLGTSCRYDGKSKLDVKVIKLLGKEVLIPVCPEQMGGQPTPRPNSEIQGGDGLDVLYDKAKVIQVDGKDITEYFMRGADEVLRLAELYNIKEAILKQRSPSCGCGQTYDGSFSGKIIKGDGVTTALLKENGIKVITEEEL